MNKKDWCIPDLETVGSKIKILQTSENAPEIPRKRVKRARFHTGD